MDYGTFFFTNIVTMTVFTVCVTLLAWRNRSVVGMRWFAGSLVLGLVKLILQGLEGKVPPVLGSMVPNELYLISSLLQLMGLHWFVVRRPFRSVWPFVAVGCALAAYAPPMFLGKIPYTGNVINLPNVLVCTASSWMLLKFGFSWANVSRVAAGIIHGAQALVMAYRAWLTNMRYIRPWETVHAQSDPRWRNHSARRRGGFLATCTVMCYRLWYLVTELGRVLAEQARTDSLTGALHRRAMEEAALRETARSMRYGYGLCMIVLDAIDNFRPSQRCPHRTRHRRAFAAALHALVTEIRHAPRSQ